MKNEACELLKLLADETRMKIVGILAKEDSYVELIAARLSITEATVCYHLKKMEQAGLVSASRSQFYIIYSLNKPILDRTLMDIVTADQSETDSEEKYNREVLEKFFKYGRLTHIPVQHKKREIVLREIARSFEAGRTYPETEVNDIIHRFHEDHCTIRREMIAFGIMERDHEIYRLK